MDLNEYKLALLTAILSVKRSAERSAEDDMGYYGKGWQNCCDRLLEMVAELEIEEMYIDEPPKPI